MKSLYKILAEENQKTKKYFQNYLYYVGKIKSKIKEFFPDVRVLIFGSVVNQEHRVGSDIDVLIISSHIPEGLFAQAEIKVKIKSLFPEAPFEFHLATPEEYEGWYKKFIKNNYIEIN